MIQRDDGILGSSAVALTLLTFGCGAPASEPIAFVQAPLACGTQCSGWVYASPHTNFLIYVPDHEGDHIPEFGKVGYKQGATGLLSENLPFHGSQPPIDNATVNWAPGTLPPPTGHNYPPDICNPSTYNHGVAIQAMLEALACDPGETNCVPADAEGVRGRVYLPRGHYAIWSTLRVKSGVALRGVSEHDNGPTEPPTTLHACWGSSAALITLGEDAVDVDQPEVDILDDLVPVGSNSVRIGLSPPLVTGQTVKIRRRSPAAWIQAIDMDQFPQWAADSMDIVFYRTITRVQTDGTERRIFFDQPITNALEGRYGPHRLRPYSRTPTQRAAVFNLKGVSHQNVRCTSGMPACSGGGSVSCDPFDTPICSPSSQQAICQGSAPVVAPTCGHSPTMVYVQNVKDAWIKEIVGSGFSKHVVNITENASQVTVEEAQYTQPLGINAGGWRYALNSNGQGNLVAHSYANDGRHDYVFGERVPGPNVFFESESDQAWDESGPHLKWGVGALFDNLNSHSTNPDRQAGAIEIRNRLDAGSNHGWSGANNVVWNSTASEFRVFNPPTAQNWLSGPDGVVIEPNEGMDRNENLAYFNLPGDEEPGPPVQPTSLYRTAAAQANPASAKIEFRHYFVGDADNFGNASGADNNDTVFVNPNFSSWVQSQSGLGVAKLDSTEDHKNLPISFPFDLATDETLVHAYLALRVRRQGAYTGNSHHAVQIGAGGTNFSDTRTFYWSCAGVTPPCEPFPSNITGLDEWPFNSDPVIRVIDLAPYLDLLRHTSNIVTLSGRRFGELNVNFRRRTRVDWAALSLVIRK